MLPALNATWLPNHDNGGVGERIFSQPPFKKGGLGGFSRLVLFHSGFFLIVHRPGFFLRNLYG
jgi:hypothetical protein